MEWNTFFVFMALVGGPALCVLTMVICKLVDKD